MTQADSVHSTPRTDTPVRIARIQQKVFPPVDQPTRRRFLTVAAVGSIVGAGGLAAAAMAPNSVAQAVTVPARSPSAALRAAIDRLVKVHAALTIAQAANEEAEAMWTDWEAQNPSPASRRGRKRWARRANAHRESLVSQPWQALMTAENAFTAAQIEVARVPSASPADMQTKTACSILYDEVALAAINRAPIARAVALENFRLGKAVLS